MTEPAYSAITSRMLRQAQLPPTLPGFVHDLKAYEVALLEGMAITETPDKGLKAEAASKEKSMAALLDDMKAAYVEKYGDE